MNKTALILVLTLVFTFQVQSQDFWGWTDPEPLTDSIHDNCNAFLYGGMFGQDNSILFWDKTIDSVTTEIWMNYLFDGLPPEVALSAPGIKYTHPKAIYANNYANSDTLLFVLFESNQNGNQDIYYAAYLTDGSFSSPEPLTLNPEDDTQLTVDRTYFYDAIINELNKVCWISGGQLYGCVLMYDSAHYFSMPYLIDSLLCGAPSNATDDVYFGWTEDNVLYHRTDTNGTFLYQSFYLENGGWGPPELVYDSLESMNPTRKSYYGPATWSALADSGWMVLSMDWDSSYLLYDIFKSTPFDPAVLGIAYGVDFWDQWVAVTYPDDGVDEIFMTNGNWPPEFDNFSNSGTMNRNPKFYNGEPHWDPGCWFDYLIWESYRNGHWQIWASKTRQCAGSIQEAGSEEQNLSAHPNPFIRETILEFTLETRSDVLIQMYDNRGVKVDEIANHNMDKGDHQLRWNAGALPAGIYIIKMSTGDKTYSSKLVKSQ